MRHSRIPATVCGLFLLVVGSAQTEAQTWETARLVTPFDHDTKGLSIAPAHGGGFHMVWNNAHNWYIHYMRYTREGGFSPVRTAFTRNFNNNPKVAESGGNVIWITFEDWKDGVQAAVVASSDNGLTWSPEVKATNFGESGGVKFPAIVPIGGPYSRQMLVTTVSTAQNRMFSNRWDGFRFLGTQEFGVCTSWYWSTGSTSEPAGGAYRTYGRNDEVFLNYWNGERWTGETQISANGEFFAWPQVAANDFGRVCVVWDKNARILVRVSQSGGWGPITDLVKGHHPNVTALAGRDEFYLTYNHDDILWGRRWSQGSWGPEVRISVGVATAMTVVNSVCSDAWGTLYCIWEYWPLGRPQTYFSMTRDYELAATPTPRNTPPPQDTPTITPTFTSTHTFTATVTPTVTNTPRDTRTFTPTTTAQTPTFTPTWTPSSTPSRTPTFTRTATPGTLPDSLGFW